MNTSAFHDVARDQLYRRLHDHEVKRRIDFLNQHSVMTCAEALIRLQASGLSHSQALVRIRSQRTLFYVQFVDVAYFPCFQWKHVILREIIGEVLEVFRCYKTHWQTALWFADENELLDDLRPVDFLETEPRRILRAAMSEVLALDYRH